jgi:hypothetical protein
MALSNIISIPGGCEKVMKLPGKSGEIKFLGSLFANQISRVNGTAAP